MLCCTGAGAGPLSTHERRMARVAERVRALEAQNMGDKDWFMRGETSAGVLAALSAYSQHTYSVVPNWCTPGTTLSHDSAPPMC